MEGLGIDVVPHDPRSIDGALADTFKIGTIVGRGRRGQPQLRQTGQLRRRRRRHHPQRPGRRRLGRGDGPGRRPPGRAGPQGRRSQHQGERSPTTAPADGPWTGAGTGGDVGGSAGDSVAQPSSATARSQPPKDRQDQPAPSDGTRISGELLSTIPDPPQPTGKRAAARRGHLRGDGGGSGIPTAAWSLLATLGLLGAGALLEARRLPFPKRPPAFVRPVGEKRQADLPGGRT